MKNNIQNIVLLNMETLQKMIKNHIDTEKNRLIEVYTEDYYINKMEEINTKINNLIQEMNQF